MNDKVNRFCDSVHEKLGTLDGRVDSLRSNSGSTWYFLQDRLDEVRHKGQTAKQAVTQARTRLSQWDNEKKPEAKATIEQWIKNRETGRLVARARAAEDYAGVALEVAEASIDDAERLVLEAIAARLDAQAPSTSLNRLTA